MNEYKIIIGATDPLGIKFLANVVKFANKGATLCQEHPYTCRFPHKAVMFLSTDEYLESDIVNGVKVEPVNLVYTVEMLEALSWEKFKSVVRKGGVTKGRDRKVMQTQYLKNTGQIPGGEEVASDEPEEDSEGKSEE